MKNSIVNSKDSCCQGHYRTEPGWTSHVSIWKLTLKARILDAPKQDYRNVLGTKTE